RSAAEAAGVAAHECVAEAAPERARQRPQHVRPLGRQSGARADEARDDRLRPPLGVAARAEVTVRRPLRRDTVEDAGARLEDEDAVRSRADCTDAQLRLFAAERPRADAADSGAEGAGGGQNVAAEGHV